ncbi:MAG: T9SS type A sorting domain-containing protein [Flavobacterium sp. JAD_PAG50586_2]|nr:MAG: T9SS type A sorting domain-containing protein [Flavobacterium sp. JAD_PAG50586_2]
MKKLYILLLVVFVGFVGNAQFSYPSTICINSPSVMPDFAPNTNMGGTFSSSPGLLINPVTGEINPGASAPGTYLVFYTVTAGPPDFITQTYARTVIITPPVVSQFTSIAPVCFGGAAPILPPTSINGITGTWSPVSISSTASATYTFTPNSGQCAASTTMSVTVFSAYAPFIESASGLNTVYVDENNQVVVPLELVSEMPEGYGYQWYEDITLIPEVTGANYTVNTASLTGSPRSYRIYVTHADTGCHNFSSQFMVYQSGGTPPPFADRNQNLPSGATLADIIVSGTEVRWYASANDKNNNTVNSVPLPMSTLLVDNATYYASQTINGSESVERLPVTVQLVLGIGENELASVSYFPNPVKNSLTIKALNTIDTISVINLLGQVLKTTTHNQAEVIENMSEFGAGTYFIRVSSGSRTEVFKVVKQ